MKSMKKILIKNGIIVTVNPSREIFYDGSILIENGLISWIGKTDDLPTLDTDETISAVGQILIPGLVNAHTHTGYCITRSLGMEKSKWDWLKSSIFPWLLRMGEDETYYASLLGYLECIKSGTTSLVDNQNYATYSNRNYDAAALAAQKTGLRVTYACGFSDIKFSSPSELISTLPEIEKESWRMIQNWHGKGNIRVAMSPISLTSCSDQAIRFMARISRENDLIFHTHVAEAREDIAGINKRFGGGFIEAFNKLGALDKNFMSVHSVYLTPAEVDLLSRANASVVHCPTANMLLCDGIAPIPKFRAANVNIALGTDSPNNNNDMFELMKFACLLTKVYTMDPTSITAADVLEMATINGAKALHIENEIGSLEVGKRADLTFVDYKNPRNSPLHDPVAALVYSANGADVSNVMVDGEFVLRNGKITFLDEVAVVEEVQKRVEIIRMQINQTNEAAVEK